MDYLENYCLRPSRSQGMLYLRSSRDKYDNMLVLRLFAMPI